MFTVVTFEVSFKVKSMSDEAELATDVINGSKHGETAAS